jgi:hypothetical protein
MDFSELVPDHIPNALDAPIPCSLLDEPLVHLTLDTSIEFG